MNSILNTNLKLFKQRFSQLYDFIDVENILNKIDNEDVEVLKCKNNQFTLKENNLFLHSLYNPQREADKIIEECNNKNFDAAFFYGFGLGYTLHSFVKKFPNKYLVIVEPSPIRFLLALKYFDWTEIFSHNYLVCLISAPQQNVINLEEQLGIDNCVFFSLPAHTQHNQQYFAELKELTKRNRNKKEINQNTQKKFAKLWTSNTWKNRFFYSTLNGIQELKDCAKNKKCVILAAGPSLDEVLPYLKIIKKKSILICVDTALKSCLAVGVEPDFIILMDPQYWNSRHILGLKSKSSILITEIAAYPNVFRFDCKKILLTSSNYPLGKYFEQHINPIDALSPGGSVATTAWDFARYIGCNQIYMVALDLGFPLNKTHGKNCQFEQKVFSSNTRFDPVTNWQSNSLFSAQLCIKKDYQNKNLLTDNRMSLYEWWFESKCASYQNIQTFSLTKNSLKINGITYFPLEDFLKFENQNFVIPKISSVNYQKEIIELSTKLKIALTDIKNNIQQGIKTCNNFFNNKISFEECLQKLQLIDNTLIESEYKQIISLVFPTDKELQEEFNKISDNNNQTNNSIQKSKIIYQKIDKSINLYFNIFNKNK